MTSVEFIQYISEYNARLLLIAEQHGFELLQASYVKWDDGELYLNGGISHLSNIETCAALININHYFSNQMIDGRQTL